MFAKLRFKIDPSGGWKLRLQFVFDAVNRANEVTGTAFDLELSLHGDHEIVRPLQHHEAHHAPDFGPRL